MIQPLLGYVQANVPVPDVEACLPIKEIVISACMKARRAARLASPRLASRARARARLA